MPKAVEIAKLTVNGQDYTDWETVSVKQELNGNPPYTCRFTCSEGSPLVKNWYKIQIMTGDKCSVELAGQHAFDGLVISRQVFFDARRHYVEIQAANHTELSTATVITKGQEFKNATPEQVIRSVLKGVGKKLVIEGGSLPNFPIERLSVVPGISIIDFIDNLTRHLGSGNNKVSHTANAQGDFVLAVGPSGGGDSVVEGQNMLEGREVIYSPSADSDAPKSDAPADQKKASIAVVGQRPGNDQQWGAKVASVPFLSQTFQMMGQKIVPLAIVPEIPLFSKSIVQGRGFSEGNWMANDWVTVYATVQGWLKPSGGLWERNKTVTVTSPMLVMQNEQLTSKSVTFFQDNTKGTRTVLELCNDNALNGGRPRAGQ